MRVGRTRDARALRRALGPGGLGGAILRAIVQAGHRAASQAPEVARSEVHRTVPKPIATGDYRRSWSWIKLAGIAKGRKPTPIAAVGSRVKHSIFVEAGRRAGARPPPVYAIERWMEVKGISGGRSRAFAIARSIARRGIRPKPIMGTTARRTRDNWRRHTYGELSRLAARLGRV